MCDQCGHRWQGYTTKGGKKRKDGSRSVNEYYACGGYVMKGTSVCERQVIQRDVIETLVIDTIGDTIRRMVEAADPIELRSLVRQHLGVTNEGASEELRRLSGQREEIRTKINNILDNITQENREFADERIAELKRELLELNARIEELERAVGVQVDLDSAVREMTDMLSSFGEVMQEGSIDEQRRVIRAFVRQIRLDPGSHEGRAEVFALPDFEAVTRYRATASRSSFQVVAGARFVAEKKRPGFVVDFTWRIDAAEAERPQRRVFDVTRCAA